MQDQAPTTVQIGYISQRLRELSARRADSKIKETLGPRPTSHLTEYTASQKYAMIAAGTAKLLPEYAVEYHDLYDCYTYPDREGEADFLQKLAEWRSKRNDIVRAEEKSLHAALQATILATTLAEAKKVLEDYEGNL